MKKLRTALVGILTLGLIYPGAYLVVKGQQKAGESKSKSDMTSMVSLFAVIGFIVVVAYSMEIKTFLTQL